MSDLTIPSPSPFASVIATTPSALAASHDTILRWCRELILQGQREVVEGQSLVTQLKAGGIRPTSAQAQLRRARRRLAFHEKVAAALEAGYHVCPPFFHTSMFAIRVEDDSTPPEDVNTHRRLGGYRPDVLPAGEGRYVDPDPKRRLYARRKEMVKRGDGSTHEVDRTDYINDAWKGVSLPMKATKPEIVQATARALGERIFDALGLAPARSAPDPMVVGFINHHERYRQPMCFVVAWWFDRTDLR